MRLSAASLRIRFELGAPGEDALSNALGANLKTKHMGSLSSAYSARSDTIASLRIVSDIA
jgi:hypothetical protein